MPLRDVVDALLGSTGEQRSAWLDRNTRALDEGMSYYLGPAADPLKGIARLLSALSPGADMMDMQQAGGDLMASRSPGEAVSNMGWLGTATLGMALPGRPAQAAKEGIRAYHGSPHDFDRFDMGKIGTGEGAQAYGHGLYFAESEGVAKSYKDALAPRAGVAAGGAPLSRQAIRDIADELGMERAPATAANVFERMSKSDSVDDYIAKLAEVNVDELRASFPQVATEVENEIRLVSELKARGLDIERPNKGHMYEVNIAANPDDFLDWDKPLSEQSEKVRGALGVPAMTADQINEEASSIMLARPGGEWMNHEPSRARVEELQRMLDAVPDEVTGGDFYRGVDGGPGGIAALMRDPSQSWRSDELRQKGIPGIRYLDQGSRTAGDGSRNYVVFDDSLVEIMRKYGLLGGIGLGGMAGLYGAPEPDA